MKLEPGMAYNTKVLNKVFAVLSVVFLVAVIWAVLDDYIRPWKAFQVKALGIKREVLAKEIAEIDKTIKPEELAKVEKELETAESQLAAKKDSIAQIQKELTAIKGQIYSQKLINGDFNANVTATQFEFETAAEHKSPKAPKLKAKLDAYILGFEESKDKLKDLEGQEKAIKEKLQAAEKDKVEAQKKITALVGVKERKQQSLAQSTIDPIWALRNAPFIDFLDPTVKIHQVVLDKLADDRYFQKVVKVDRCTTCHVFISESGFEDRPNPFKTHPKLDLMVGANSPHPLKNYGCTTCHGGEGHRVNDFNAPAHTPENAKQKEEWVKKYHWHEPHKVPTPMLKLSMTESSCFKCHSGEAHVPGAPKADKGRYLVASYGCYACHNMPGFDHLNKPGPSLEKISSKVDKDFFKNWVWDPKGFNPKSRMPTFFTQSNNSDPKFVRLNMAEVNAMAEYIWEKAKPYKPFMNYNPGDANKGKELITQIGCLGCHRVEGIEESDKVSARRATYLTGLGTKVSGDWLVSWLKQPSHYQEDTIMPSFRLTDSETNDIATYLLSLKNNRFNGLKFEPLDVKARDEILIDYFSAFETMESAKSKLAKMGDRERTLELGFRSVGKYGCYSCHKIEGFDGRAPIGPDLSGVGSKPVEQFGFGHQPIEHKRDVWISNHLANPRRWDQGVVKSFKDLLRMPNYYFGEEEISSIQTFILGYVSEYIPEAGKRRLSPNEAMAQKGFKTMDKLNCTGCHKVDEQFGGDILAMFDNINDGPPRLNTQGHRVKTEWFNNFLKNVVPIRPWVKVRMPTFHFMEGEKNAIVNGFRARSDQVIFEEDPAQVVWEPGEREAADTLFKKLECTTCHTVGFNNIEPTAPDLHKVKGRLRASWVERWLSDPQKIMEGTVMPNFWEGGTSTEPGILGGDSKRQIRALRKYLFEMSERS